MLPLKVVNTQNKRITFEHYALILASCTVVTPQLLEFETSIYYPLLQRKNKNLSHRHKLLILLCGLKICFFHPLYTFVDIIIGTGICHPYITLSLTPKGCPRYNRYSKVFY